MPNNPSSLTLADLLQRALIVLMLVSLGVCFFPPFFSANDDIGRWMISSGTGISLAPNAYLTFSNIILGWMLSFLFKTYPNVNWYSVFLFTCHALSIFILSISLLKKKSGLLSYLTFFSFVTVIHVYFIHNVTYTMTAFCLGISAFSLLYSSIISSDFSKKKMLVVVLLFLLASLVRKNVFFLVLILILPALAILLFRALDKVKTTRFITGCIGGALLLSVTADKIDQYAYEIYPEDHSRQLSPVLNEWYDYWKLKKGPESQAYFQSIGWTENDLNMLLAPFFSSSFFTDQILEKIGREAPHYPKFQLEKGLVAVIDSLKITQSKIVFLWALLAFLLIYTSKNFIGKKYDLIIMTGWIFVVLLLLAARMKLVYTIAIPAYSLIPLVMLVQNRELKWKDVSPLRRNSSFLLIFLLLAFPFWALKSYHGISQSLVLKESELLQDLKDLNPQKNQLFVTWRCNLRSDFLRAMGNPDTFRNLNLLETGWGLNTGAANLMMKEFKIENPFKGIYENENVFFITDLNSFENYKVFVREHYNADVIPEEKFKGKLFSVYKIRNLSR